MRANLSALDVDGLTILHMNNAWSRYMKPFSFQYCVGCALGYTNMECAADDFLTHSICLPWEPLLLPVAELCWMYS